MIYAFFALAPREGIRWMRAHWKEFQALDWEDIPIRSLQNVPQGKAAEDMVDLVLEKAGADAPPEILQEATVALRGRRGYREEDVDAFWRRALSHPDDAVVLHAEYSLDDPGHADFTDLLLPLLEKLDLSAADVLPEAAALLDILRYQPLATGRVRAAATSSWTRTPIRPCGRRRPWACSTGSPTRDARGS